MPDTVRERYERIGRRRVIALLGIGIALLAIAIIAAVVTLGSISEDTGQVEKVLERQAAIDSLSTYNEQIAAGQRGFLIQPDPDFARVVREASADYEAEQARLQDLLVSGDQIERLERIRQLNAERTALVDAMFADPATAFLDARNLDFSNDRSVIITQEIREVAKEMSGFEAEELGRRNQAQLSSLVQFYVVGGIATLLLLGVLVHNQQSKYSY